MTALVRSLIHSLTRRIPTERPGVRAGRRPGVGGSDVRAPAPTAVSLARGHEFF